MCRIAEEIWTEGWTEGLEKGRKEAQIDTIRRMMKVRDLSFERACGHLPLSAGGREALAVHFQAEP